MIAILELREGHVPGRIVVVLELSDDARVPRVELLVMKSPAQRHRCDDRRGGQRRENHVSQTSRSARSRRPIAAGARRPPPGCVRPAQQADGRDSQRARPEPDPDDPAHLAAKWTDSNQAAAARPGERKQATRRLSVVPFASIHPASQTPGMPASSRTQEVGSGLAVNINAF